MDYGNYRHHKGGLYKVLAIAKNANSSERGKYTVVYTNGKDVFTRDQEEFEAKFTRCR